MIVTNSTSSSSRGPRKSWIPLYPGTFFSAMPEKISSLRRLSYLSAFLEFVHPCQILPIMRSSLGCNQSSTLTVIYAANSKRLGPRSSSCPYSPKCVEERFCELRHDGVLRSWPLTRLSGIMLPTVSDEPRARSGRQGGRGA